MRSQDSIISVKEVDYLTPTTYILRLERKNLSFQSGQYISLGLPGDTEKRIIWITGTYFVQQKIRRGLFTGV
ncbi:MAG: hypothetical protein ISS19_01385 [Bacteroidales bacterium]|nr:hypothetical protein [Bacteroidales bacterium]